MFHDGRNPTPEMVDEMFKLARQELRQFQPWTLVAKVVSHFKGQGARRPLAMCRSLSGDVQC